jgi:hypothetical protein
VKRWIGAGRRRAFRERDEVRDAGAEIVTLTWDQTFGRQAASPKPDQARERGADGPGRVVALDEGRTSS